MMSKALLAVMCVALGAGGTYLVVRHAGPAAPTPVAAATEPTPTATVEQSEGVVADGAAVPAPVSAPAAPVRRAEAPTAPVRPAAPAPAPRPASPALKRADATAPASESAPAPRDESPVAIAPAAVTDNQASRSVDPPGPVLEELVVAAQSVIGLQMETNVSSERARVEDTVVARVTRDVKVGDRVVVPFTIACGNCFFCQRGMWAACDNSNPDPRIAEKLYGFSGTTGICRAVSISYNTCRQRHILGLNSS